MPVSTHQRNCASDGQRRRERVSGALRSFSIPVRHPQTRQRRTGKNCESRYFYFYFFFDLTLPNRNRTRRSARHRWSSLSSRRRKGKLSWSLPVPVVVLTSRRFRPDGKTIRRLLGFTTTTSCSDDSHLFPTSFSLRSPSVRRWLVPVSSTH